MKFPGQEILVSLKKFITGIYYRKNALREVEALPDAQAAN